MLWWTYRHLYRQCQRAKGYGSDGCQVLKHSVVHLVSSGRKLRFRRQTGTIATRFYSEWSWTCVLSDNWTDPQGQKRKDAQWILYAISECLSCPSGDTGGAEKLMTYFQIWAIAVSDKGSHVETEAALHCFDQACIITAAVPVLSNTPSTEQLSFHRHLKRDRGDEVCGIKDILALFWHNRSFQNLTWAGSENESVAGFARWVQIPQTIIPTGPHFLGLTDFNAIKHQEQYKRWLQNGWNISVHQLKVLILASGKLLSVSVSVPDRTGWG